MGVDDEELVGAELGLLIHAPKERADKARMAEVRKRIVSSLVRIFLKFKNGVV